MADADAAANDILTILSNAGVDIEALAPELLKESGYGLKDITLDSDQQAQLDAFTGQKTSLQKTIDTTQATIDNFEKRLKASKSAIERAMLLANIATAKKTLADANTKMSALDKDLYPLTRKGLYKLSEEELMTNMSVSQRVDYENKRLIQDRQNKALKGELPINAGLQQSLDEQRAASEAGLSRNLGVDWQNSTVGQKNLSLTQQREALIKDAASRGDMTTATNLLGAQQGIINNQSVMNQQALSGYANRNMGLIGGYQAAMAPGLAQMGYDTQRQIANTAANAQEQAGLYGLIGTFAGAGIAKYCWVAREVYGEDNPKWLMFRSWLENKAPKWFYNLYIKHGERFAKFIHNKPILKYFIRLWMDSRIEVNYAIS